jgi:adenylate kinase
MANKNLVLFGAPGAGKGTLANKIKKINTVVHISTGDLFRENIKNGTPIGKEAKGYMDAGKLVPDSVVIGMVKDRIAQDDVKKNGFMLDGFPRTLEQAKALDAVAKIDRVIVIDIAKDDLKNRILGRFSCPKCGKIYNIYNAELKPKKEGMCDTCPDTKLDHRSDDNEETFEKRWNTYLSQSEDVIKYYSAKAGLVKHVDGNKTMAITDAELKTVIS